MINGARVRYYAPRTPTQRMARKTKHFLSRLRRWRQKARWARRKLAGVPRIVRIAGVVAILLAVVGLTNIVYQVIQKPTELFAFVGHRLDKEPAETWRQYGALFRTYSTGTIPPELLAALAQGQSSGNPVERSYWRWRWSFNPFAIYQPASSAVGLFQMTDGLTPRPRGFASGRRPSLIPVAGSVPTFARSRAMPSNLHPYIWTAMWPRSSPARK